MSASTLRSASMEDGVKSAGNTELLGELGMGGGSEEVAGVGAGRGDSSWIVTVMKAVIMGWLEEHSK